MNLSHQRRQGLTFVFLSDLAASVAFDYVACHVIGIPFACLSLMKSGLWHPHEDVFLNLTRRLLAVALHKNMEAQAFLQ
jgi:hypothetical protein